MSGRIQTRLGPISRHRYSDRMFRSLESFPSENTLTVNITHKQLRQLDPPFSSLVAIAPTRYEEGANNATNTPKGYDIKLETAKEIVFQHKAPDNAVVRDGKQWLNYKIDTKQLKNLFQQYSPKEAFYALPATPGEHQIRDGLDRTIFVDVWSIRLHDLHQGEDTSRIYVEYTSDPNGTPKVKGKFNTRKRSMGGYPYYNLKANDHIYGDAVTWKPIEDKLKGCVLGLPIRGVESEIYPYSEIERVPPGLPDDYPAEFNPAYRDFLRRRHAIYQYTKGERQREDILEWLVDSFRTRYTVAIQNEWVTSPPDIELTDVKIRNLIRSDLETLGSSRHPLNIRLDRTQRCILERGEQAESVTV